MTSFYFVKIYERLGSYIGAVGGLLGLNGGAGGTGFNTTSGTNAGQINTAYNQNQTALQGQNGLLSALQGQNGLGNQTQNYGQLQGIINGQGPNPAQAMLNQATGANVANQASLMAGQRGAGANVGLMARQAAQQGAGLQQQAAGQGATMQANQSLGALQQAGAMANQMAGQQIGQTNQNVASNQNEQNILQGANTANNQVQGQLANTTMQGQQGLIGGAMNGAGALMGIAGGGMVPKLADGGSVGPQSMFGQALLPVNMGPGAGFGGVPNAGAQSMANSMKSKPKAPSDPLAGATDVTNSMGPDMSMMAAKGGQVPVMLSPGERKLSPQEAQAVAKGKANPMKVGGQIPGKAKVAGDDYANDTVKDSVKPGSVIIPRSVMNSKDPARGAAEFVRATLAKKKVSK